MTVLSTLLRSFSAPLGVFIGKKLEKLMGKTHGAIAGGIIASAIIEAMITNLDKTTKRTLALMWGKMNHKSQLIISNKEKIKSISSWIREHHEDVVAKLACDEDNHLIISEFKSGAKILIKGVPVGISRKDSEDTKFILSYQIDQITPLQIMDHFQMRIARSYALLTLYTWVNNGWSELHDYPMTKT